MLILYAEEVLKKMNNPHVVGFINEMALGDRKPEREMLLEHEVVGNSFM